MPTAASYNAKFKKPKKKGGKGKSKGKSKAGGKGTVKKSKGKTVKWAEPVVATVHGGVEVDESGRAKRPAWKAEKFPLVGDCSPALKVRRRFATKTTVRHPPALRPSLSASDMSALDLAKMPADVWAGKEKTKANNKIYSEVHKHTKTKLMSQPGMSLFKALKEAGAKGRAATQAWRQGTLQKKGLESFLT